MDNTFTELRALAAAAAQAQAGEQRPRTRCTAHTQLDAAHQRARCAVALLDQVRQAIGSTGPEAINATSLDAALEGVARLLHA